SAHGSRRSLRLQSNAPIPFILEGIHLLLNHVGRLSDTALKQHGMLEHRRDNLCHIIGAGQLSCLALHPCTSVHTLAVPVFHSSWRLCNHNSSSSVIRTLI